MRCGLGRPVGITFLIFQTYSSAFLEWRDPVKRPCHSSQALPRVLAERWSTSNPGRIWAQNPEMAISAAARTGWRQVLTLDMSLNTETWACSKSSTTSRRLLSIDSSSPTARVMRPARLLRKAWSMLSSQGEPGARKALYSPDMSM